MDASPASSSSLTSRLRGKIPVSYLHEFCQRNNLKATYELVYFNGSPHEPVWVVQGKAGKISGRGEGPNKREAKHNAALAIIRHIHGWAAGEAFTLGIPPADAIRRSHVTLVSDLALREGWPRPNYTYPNSADIHMLPDFRATVELGVLKETGHGRTKQLAKHAAAKVLWRRLTLDQLSPVPSTADDRAELRGNIQSFQAEEPPRQPQQETKAGAIRAEELEVRDEVEIGWDNPIEHTALPPTPPPRFALTAAQSKPSGGLPQSLPQPGAKLCMKARKRYQQRVHAGAKCHGKDCCSGVMRRGNVKSVRETSTSHDRQENMSLCDSRQPRVSAEVNELPQCWTAPNPRQMNLDRGYTDVRQSHIRTYNEGYSGGDNFCNADDRKDHGHTWPKWTSQQQTLIQRNTQHHLLTQDTQHRWFVSENRGATYVRGSHNMDHGEVHLRDSLYSSVPSKQGSDAAESLWTHGEGKAWQQRPTHYQGVSHGQTHDTSSGQWF